MIVGNLYVVFTVLAKPPKDKLSICICAAENLFFWINTQAASHGIGQLQLEKTDHGALTHSCFLDCSRVTTFQERELLGAKDRGPISDEFLEKIIEILTNSPPKTLPKKHLSVAMSNLIALLQQRQG